MMLAVVKWIATTALLEINEDVRKEHVGACQFLIRADAGPAPENFGFVRLRLEQLATRSLISLLILKLAGTPAGSGSPSGK